MAPPRAIILGCAGGELAAAERRFFTQTDPLGFILFERNCQTPDQVRALTRALRESVGRAAPILIDQEGGRVARLKPPHWRAAPPAGVFGMLAQIDPEKAGEAVYLNARLLAAELHEVGIDVDCAPVLDLPAEGAHGIIGDRALAADPGTTSRLGRRACAGFLDGGVLPVIKHIPGHGRAVVDSHRALPVIKAPRHMLEKWDFAPFRVLNDMPWAMTAHVVYTAFDAERPATQSDSVIFEIIRGLIGFEGFLISDDLSMDALKGSFERRAFESLSAGCDTVVHGNGKIEEMAAAVEGAFPLTTAAQDRLQRGDDFRKQLQPIDKNELLSILETLLEESGLEGGGLGGGDA